MVLGLAVSAKALPVWSTDYISGVTANSDRPSRDTWVVSDITNQSGLSDSQGDDGFKETHAAGAPGNAWISGFSKATWISFDFPGTDSYYVDDMYVWNFNQSATRGLHEISIWYSNDATTKDNGTWTKLGDYDLQMGSFNTSETYTDVISFDTNVKWVKFLDQSATAHNDYDTGIDTHGEGEDGLSEVAFFTPEPATVAILGLGSIALLRRRR